jgi:predicted protein tyrosine phosphatase
MTRRAFPLLVLSREAAEQYQPEGREICISIRDPWYPPASLSPAFHAVLDLAFSDITEGETDVDVIFCADHAVEIIRFVNRFAELDRIVVHCHVGASRSPGVALGLCDHFDWPTAELEQSYPAWNRLVRQVLAAQRNREE